MALGILWFATPAHAQASLPTMVVGHGNQITPSNAVTAYGALTSPARTSDPDVDRLAQALGNDIDRIYAFVHDDIEVLWMFGVKAGARGAIIDKAGTPFDQTHLMVELAREAGFTAQYRWGTIKPTLAQMLAWTGMPNQAALEELLKDGGFPYQVFSDGGITKVRLLHLWAEVTIGGTAYVFDPAFKGHTTITGYANIDAESGFNPTTFVSDALAGSTGQTTNSTAQVKDLSRTNVQEALQEAAEALQGQIATDKPNGDIKDVVGGREITPLASAPPHVTALPYIDTNIGAFAQGIPVKLRTKATVSFSYSGHPTPTAFSWYADEIYGEQLVFEPIPHKGGPTSPEQFRFRRGDTPLTDWLPGTIPGPSVAVDHPYAADGTTYMDRTVGMGGGGVSGSLQLVLGFGKPSKDLGAWMEVRNNPTEGETIRGYGTEAEVSPVSNQTAQRRRMGAGFLAQLTEAGDMVAALGNVELQQHDVLGFVTSNYYPGDLGPPAGTSYHIGIETAISATPKNGSAETAEAAERTYALMVPTLEGSLPEQMGDSVYAVSTPAKLDWAVDGQTGDDWFYYATPANWTWVKSQILDDLDGGSRTKSAGEAYIAAGYHLIIPKSSNLGPGNAELRYCASNPAYQPAPDCTITGTERGGAFVAINPTTGAMAHIIARLYGMAKGGGGGDDAEIVPGKLFAIPEDFKDRQYTTRAESYDVDLKTGTLTYTPPPDLVVGNGAYPYSLSFQRTYRSGGVRPAPTGEQYNPDDPLFGESGWTSNLNHRVNPSSDAIAAFGGDDPRSAASTIVAIRAMLAVSGDGATDLDTLRRQLIANMTAWWWTRTLILNTMTIEHGADSRSFVRLANGDWAPPRGRDETLEVQGTRRLMEPLFVGPEFWSYKNICIKLTGADRSVSSYGPSEWAAPYALESCPTNLGSRNAQVEANFRGLLFRRQAFPYGVQVDRRSDGGLENNLGRELKVTGGATSPGQFNVTVADNDDSTRAVTFSGGGDVDTLANVEHMAMSGTDAEGHVWTFVSDAAGFRAYAPTQPLKPFLTFDYRDGLRGAVDGFIDANRNRTDFFISSGRAAATEDPLGGLSYVRYDEFGQPVVNINRLGHATHSAYDNHRRVIRTVQPEGNAEEYAYDSRHNRTETRRKPKPGGSPPADIVTSATYHSTFNVPLTETDALGAVTNYTYQSGTGLLLTMVQPDPDTTDGDPARPTTTFTWKNCPGASCRGQRETKTDPTGIILRYTYDAANFLDTVTSGYGTGGTTEATTSFDYDAAGNIISLTDPLNRTHTAEWDDMRRITRWVGPSGTGAETRWTYDADGLVREIKQATGLSSPNDWAVTTLKYEPTARVREIIDPEGVTGTGTYNATRFHYDALNRLILTADQKGRTTASVYDAEGQVIQERRGDGSTEPVAWVTRTFTPNGKVATFADANPSTTGYVYDRFDRLITTQFPHPVTGAINTADTEALTYDANGNVLTRTTRGGHVLTMDYDRLNRLVEKVVPAWGITPARTASYAYDLAGRQDLVTETGGHELDWTYDAAGRPSNLAIEGPQWAGTKVIGWQYDKAGNRTRLTWPDSYYVSYTYDALNRLDTATQFVSGTPTLLADYTYDARSQRTGAAFDMAGAGGTVGAIFSQAGNLTTVDHDWASGGVTVTYSYDLGHRLLNETFTDANYRWVLGAANTEAYDPDRLNRYIRADGDQNVDMTYDGNHNLATWGAWSYTHDPENRMTRAQRPGMLATYLYDPLGRRVKKTASGGIGESYLLDGDEEIAEYDSTGTLVRRFIPSNATDAPIATVTAAGVRNYFRVNRQGTVMAMTSSTGVLVEGPFQYGPYGEPDGADMSSSGVPFRYTGRRYDPETALYYYRARYYNPEHGRFLETDPIGYEGGANLYSYVDNSPTFALDPDGEAPRRDEKAPPAETSPKETLEGAALATDLASEGARRAGGDAQVLRNAAKVSGALTAGAEASDAVDRVSRGEETWDEAVVRGGARTLGALGGGTMGGAIGVLAGGGTPAEVITLPAGIIIGGQAGANFGDGVADGYKSAKEFVANKWDGLVRDIGGAVDNVVSEQTGGYRPYETPKQ